MCEKNKTVDVIIPTYKPDDKFNRLISMLGKQSYPINRIIIMNTEKKYWKDELYKEINNLEVHHITVKEFDHGATRHAAVELSQADIVMFMTQDAVPENSSLVEKLVESLTSRWDEQFLQPAIAFARQLPEEGCKAIEYYTRMFNYPDKSIIRTLADYPEIGIKTFFCSNVCAAYNRNVYLMLGGFVQKTIFNEDMLYAAKAARAGFTINYVAEARVYHSHNYTCMQQFRRNFDLAVSQADHPEIFEGVPSEGEGIRLVIYTAVCIVKSGKVYLLPALIMKSAVKYLGYQFGKHYKYLPKSWVKAFSMNVNYWR